MRTHARYIQGMKINKNFTIDIDLLNHVLAKLPEGVTFSKQVCDLLVDWLVSKPAPKKGKSK